MTMASVRREIMDDLNRSIKKSIDDSIVWDLMKMHYSDWIEVRIPWRTKQRPTLWHEVCVWALEQFGLPGDRYVTHPDRDEMTYLFRDSQDAVLMTLRWA